MDANFAGLAVRMVASLAVVIALLGLAARFARRQGLAGPRQPAPWARIEVLSRSALGRSSSAAVVRVAGRVLLLGVTDQSVGVLTELEAAPDGSGMPALGQGTGQETGGVGRWSSSVPLDRLRLPGRTERSSPAPTGNGGPAGGSGAGSLVDALRERTVRRS